VSHQEDKVLEHAQREFAAVREVDPPHLVPLYQRFLKIENHRLRLRHQAGGGGRDVCASRASLIDIVLRHVFSAATASAQARSKEKSLPLSLVALGGYGRSELNPSSDVDVMFLHSQTGRQLSDALADTIQQVLYFLWDLGFKVGHSTRTVKDAMAQANEDMRTKTSLLEARLLAGDVDLFHLFRTQFRRSCVKGYERQYIAARMEDQALRHQKFGNSVYLQEPNVKGGCGGLRDYQNLLWITYFKEGALTTTHLVGKDWLTAGDRRRIDIAYDFLLRIRTQLHYTNERATDTLHLSLQAEIARQLGYGQKTPIARSEAFMKDYYEHSRDIFRITERLTKRFASGAGTTTRRLFFPLLPRRGEADERFENFFSRGGQLHVNDPQIFGREPEQLMKAFEHAQKRKLELSAELTDAIGRRLRYVTREFRYAKAPREIFAQILRRKGEVAQTLRMMHEVDFLGRYLPEFGHLTCLVQHEYFHRYTADEHTLVCLEKLDALCKTENPKLQPYRKLFEKISDPYVLYLALLLHDTGKGVGAWPHSEASALFAQAVAVRLQLNSEQRRSLVLLVDHHVTMSSMAQQRNVDDPATVIEFANIVKSQANLDALMLVTLADGQGTTDAWSDWKESLVWTLYHETSAYLQNQEEFIAQAKIERERIRQTVAEKLPPDFADELEAHFDYMPENYFRSFEVEEIVAHFELFRTLWRKFYVAGEPAYAPALRWQTIPQQGHSVVSIVTWDRQNLLASIAGAFAVASVNILSADIFSRADNLVLDVFRVRNEKLGPITDPAEIVTVESSLRLALQDERFDFAPLIADARRRAPKQGPEIEFPTRISIENKSHPTWTLIQVETPDRLGLLYDLVSCLGRHNVSIALSRISTDKGAAIDTFYVTDAGSRGKIIESSRVDELQRQLHAATVAPPPND
jgi:[protein-PII] uridylyltransferase